VAVALLSRWTVMVSSVGPSYSLICFAVLFSSSVFSFPLSIMFFLFYSGFMAVLLVAVLWWQAMVRGEEQFFFLYVQRH
jgi:hypothetical protein